MKSGELEEKAWDMNRVEAQGNTFQGVAHHTLNAPLPVQAPPLQPHHNIHQCLWKPAQMVQKKKKSAHK